MKPPFELDPNGRAPNEAGAKLDAGKVCPSLVIEGMARAIWGVAEVATFGMRKYTRDGWVSVPDGQFRYANAQYRHILKKAMGEQIDPDSNLEHLKHEAWNALAKLDLAMREQENAIAKQRAWKAMQEMDLVKKAIEYPDDIKVTGQEGKYQRPTLYGSVYD